MSAGLLTALKVIPWGDVITAAPAILKGARGLFSRSPPAPEPPVARELLPAEARVAQLEAALGDLTRAHRELAQVTASLAEQNAKVVQAIEVLRVRTRLLALLCGVFGLLAIAAMALSYSGFGRG